MNCRLCKNELTNENWSEYNKKSRTYLCKKCYPLHRKEKRDILIQKKRQWVWQHKLRHPCPCGERDPRLLDFHHIEKKTKGISELVNSGASLERLINEIDKCVVLCLRCHRLKHWTGYVWYGPYRDN
jgi:hypothetical protein